MPSKGKIPYIEHNGKIVEDSSFIIQHLNSEYKKDLNAHLTPAEKAIALSFQRLVEDNLYWSLAYQRWLMDDSILDLIPFPNRFATKLFSWYTSLKLRPELRKNMRVILYFLSIRKSFTYTVVYVLLNNLIYLSSD